MTLQAKDIFRQLPPSSIKELMKLEQLMCNQWPAVKTTVCEGWLVQLSNGFTKRANSVIPLSLYNPHEENQVKEEDRSEDKDKGKDNETEQGSQEKFACVVACCETIYSTQQLPAIFRLANIKSVRKLDDILAARNYRCSDLTLVQTLELEQALRSEQIVRLKQAIKMDQTTRLEETMGSGRTIGLEQTRFSFSTNTHIQCELMDHPSIPWINYYLQFSNQTANQSSLMLQMLSSVKGKSAYLLLKDEQSGEVAACGLAIIDGIYMGLHHLVVAPAFRKQGLGTRLVLHLLQWGNDNGAHQCFLAVLANNESALHLYNKFGFIESYRYWYRIAATL